MKKNYLTPNIFVVDINMESLMQAISKTNIQENGTTGMYIQQGDVNGTAGSGDVLDAAGYRSNLWGD